MADYVIVYFKRGAHLSTSPWRGDLGAAKNVARIGLTRPVQMNSKSDLTLWAGRFSLKSDAILNSGRSSPRARLDRPSRSPEMAHRPVLANAVEEVGGFRR